MTENAGNRSFLHTGKFLLSLKQIGTICFLTIILISPTFADNEPTTPTLIPSSEPGCNQAVLNTTEGSAALEAIYTPNTIGTTWYSDGVQLEVDNAATSCTYDTAMTLPTNPTKPGYEFNGWKIRPECKIPSTDVSNAPNAYAAKRLNGGDDNTNGGATAATYGISDPGEWGASWSNGDKVTGVALCSQTSGTYPNTGTPDETGSGETKNCWCQATHYTANNAQQCSLSAPAWVSEYNAGSAADCADGCAKSCANRVRWYSGFRATLFGSN